MTLTNITRHNLTRTLIPSAVIPITLALLLISSFQDETWEHIPLHSLLEGVGALAAILVATFILLLRNTQQLGKRHIWVATSLMSMGLLDGFHAAVHPGDCFVWLHSLATFVGGVTFAMILLPERVTRYQGINKLPYLVAGASIIIALASVVDPEIIPQMLAPGDFTPNAMILNITGGAGFILAWSGTIFGKLTDNNEEKLFLSNQALLFGMAGLLFGFSTLWDSTWWLWHILRLSAYLVVLWYFILLYFRLTNESKYNETRFRTLVESTSDWIWEIDEHDKFTYVSPKIRELLGYEPEEVIGKSAFDLMAKNEAEKVDRVYRDLIENHQPFSGMININQHKDGHEVILESNGIPLFNDTGKWVGYRGIDRDITDRIAAKTALQQERDFATKIINTAPAIVLILNRDGTIAHVNPYFEELSGYSLKQIRGKEWFQTFLPERDQDAIRLLFHNAWGEEQTNGNINAIVTRDGKEREIEWHYTTLRGEQGNIQQLLSIGLDVTERKQAIESLQAIKGRLDEAQRMARIGSWELDLIKNHLWWSDENFRIFGFEVNEFGASYEAFLDTIHPDDRDMVNKAYTSSLKNRKPYSITHRLLMADGTIKYVHEQCETLYNEAGEPILSRGTTQEVTEQVEAENALRLSENRFHTLARMAPVGIFQTNPDGECSYVNETWLSLAGMEFEQAMGHGWSNALHPEDRDLVFNAWKTSAQENRPFAMEYRFLRPDATSIWVYGQAEANRDETGKIINYVGTITNIDERKNSELTHFETQRRMRKQQRAMLLFSQQQKNSTENLQSLYRTLCETVAGQLDIERVSTWLFSPSGDTLVCEDLYTYSTKQHSSGQTLSSKDYPTYFNVLKTNRVVLANDACAHPVTQEFTDSYLKPNHITSIMDAPLRDGNGNVIGVLCNEHTGKPRQWHADEESFANAIADMLSLSIELSARKQTENELKQYQTDLEKMVALRTQELSNINRELESFTYSVSHDLRTPLRGIDGFSRILLDKYGDQLDPQGQDYLRRVRAAAQRMGQLINDLLQLSRASREEINLQTVSLSTIAEQSAKELQQAEPARKVDIEIEDGMQAVCDPRLLRIVLDNLIGNAWKFTGKCDYAHIEVGRLPGSEEAIYFVRDNGAGFDMRYVDKLFQVFQRLHGIDDFPGTGVGLSTVARLLHRLGGRIWAEAEVDKGACFFFTLTGNENGHTHE